MTCCVMLFDRKLHDLLLFCHDFNHTIGTNSKGMTPDEAVQHLNRQGKNHTYAIITDNLKENILFGALIKARVAMYVKDLTKVHHK